MDYLDKIGQIFFGLPPNRRQPRGLLGKFFIIFQSIRAERSRALMLISVCPVTHIFLVELGNRLNWPVIISFAKVLYMYRCGI